MADSVQPGCFLHTAGAHESGHVSSLEFFQRTLRHLGPTATRVHHSEDNQPPEETLSRLFWKGRFGPVAAAIKLCGSDPCAPSVNPDQLAQLFMSCIYPNAAFESVQSRVTNLDTPVMTSALFRQALTIAAIQSDNAELAIGLIQQNPHVQPSPDDCVFTWSMSPRMVDSRDIPAGVHAALVKAGWEQPSQTLLTHAANCPDGEGGLALFSALRGAGYEDWMSDSWCKEDLPDRALHLGSPRILRYLWDVYSINEYFESNLLIKAVESRQSGGVEMINWLLEQGLDVNYMRIPLHPDPEIRGVDPRDRAERDWAYRHRPWSSKKTALHAAAWKGNMEAARFLLERGANPHMQNGLGQTADIIARGGGYEDLANLVESKMREVET